MQIIPLVISDPYRLARRFGIPLRVRVQGRRGARKRGSVGAKTRLSRLGVDVPRNPKPFWRWPEEEQQALVLLARKAWLVRISSIHPDRQGDTAKAAELNATWTALKKLCRRHGLGV